MSDEPVQAMAAALSGALRLVDGVRHQQFLGDDVDPPATVLLAPSLTWEAYGVFGPTSAEWLVALVVPADERALARLWVLLPSVSAALDGVRDAVITRAEPGTFPAGSVELPAYLITVETAL